MTDEDPIPTGWRSGRRRLLAVCLIVLPLIPVLPWMLLTGPWSAKLGFVASVSVPTVAVTPAVRLNEYAGRVSSEAAAVLLCGVALVAGIAALVNAWRKASLTVEWPYLAGTWLVVALVVEMEVVLKGVAAGAGASDRVYALLGDLYAKTLGVIDGNRSALNALDMMLDVSNTAVIFAATSLALASAVAALEILRVKENGDPAGLKRLERRLDLILLGAAATLVAGTIAVAEWTAWPAVFVNDETVKAYTRLTTAFMGFQGVCYVGVLVAIYLPAAWMLDSAYRELVPGEAGTTGPMLTRLTRLFAVLSPLLAGPVATFLGAKVAG